MEQSVNKCLEIFDKILRIPLEYLYNIGTYEEDANDSLESIKEINFHGIVIDILINNDDLEVILSDDQGCTMKLQTKLTNRIIDQFDSYLIKRQSYSDKCLLDYFEKCLNNIKENNE